ncbi:MAG: pentapeptide repeat-containing protein [cyanobacterium endosymbiont of Rhopalodia sterrenbergii]
MGIILQEANFSHVNLSRADACQVDLRRMDFSRHFLY